MKNVQKIFTLLLTAALLLVLPACGNEVRQPGETETTSNTQISDTPQPTDAPDTTTPAEVDTPTPESAYTGILTYDYACEAGYYSCMYITPDKVYLWSGAATPDLQDPTASVGFAQAYTESLPRAQFEKATAAISDEFFEVQKTIPDSPSASDGISSLSRPSAHIAVYRDGQLCRYRYGVGIAEDHTPETEAFRAVFAELDAIRDALTAEKGTPKTVAILRYSQSARSCRASYYTARESLQWECAAPPDWDAPLSGIDESTQVTREQGDSDLLIKLGGYSEYMPLRVYETNPAKIPDGGSFEVMVFYREDGSRRVISAHASDNDSRVLNTMRAYFALHWAKPA